MLIDDVTVRLEAGHGGHGSVAFNKVRLSQGPTGGDGGRGGSFYFEGVSDINALAFFSGRKVLRAENGKNGRGQFIDGKNGTDMVLKVPAGTRITNQGTGFMQEITEVGERILAAGGGSGGRGNFKFRSSTNTTPKESEDGKKGDIVECHLELRLIADVGLVGLPNAGKSSLLNELTNAKSKVAHYAFTTLEPHLGAYYGRIIADIPGLIEGASSGKGLGVKFLKHIERTKRIFHLISAESEDPVYDYKILRRELEIYNPELAKKEEQVFLTKSDSVSSEKLETSLRALEDDGVKSIPISVLDAESLESVKRLLS
ncbi:MAG: GTPase obg [Candidatus Kaiserbacteria bacterium GW2011_GWC2_49_12]|uniref:GTPase Obg n=4 Tax=Candidatus Kaiseribacteriota TaxID=1752734 RepID=A0A0G1ZFE5_9BACT|nr:MAG: GTPase obg [Candidatus Kaiserbacteria bacterium GW2011_GWC2_49_12]KKW17979.1 MAG: GTPase obg [Candidatus Kaiserbacteria bacterium GW2011_GWB1_50_17]KKW18631.1 MAG: GTPase obg [Candidatus Kaiserbacteria bacterium GW2011_GWA1_50_28]OGG87439.1 MAG: Obg family GTPase CgtA [Candidatus Kaiserbacteria bacterium RIFCSPLOWO2_12_FULL_50_28]HCM43528.1 GTPase ObgE [Candidatus Kaiserbacteria bacterium]